MRITIDPERCSGHGRCYDLASDLFLADDAGRGMLRLTGDVPPELEASARRAIDNCPERAIAVHVP